MTKRRGKILCATCRASIDADVGTTCTACGSPPTLGGRYVLVAPLGKGASGVTWRGRSLVDGRAVAIKERFLVDARSFRELDRVRREAYFYAGLEHPRIPRLIEHFVVEAGSRTGFYLVTELVRGATLAEENVGPRADVPKILEELASLLDILAYLHTRAPAVVHGDVKPENIVRRASDGALFVVDFHAARSFPSPAEVGMTTAIGTPGFMAPEQLTGHAEPATDIHAAACVAVARLTRRPLYTLVDDDFRLKWKDAVDVSSPVRQLLARMLEPSLSRRAKNAGELAREARLLASGRLRRRTMPWGALTVAGAAAVLGGAILFKLSAPQRIATALTDRHPLVGSVLASVRSFDARSKCEAQGHCKRINESNFAAELRVQCAKVEGKTTGVGAFSLPLGGDHGRCVVHREHDGYGNDACIATCVFESERAETVAAHAQFNALRTALADAYGRPTSANHVTALDGRSVLHWNWRDPSDTHAKGVWSMSAAVFDEEAFSSIRPHLELTIREPC